MFVTETGLYHHKTKGKYQAYVSVGGRRILDGGDDLDPPAELPSKTKRSHY